MVFGILAALGVLVWALIPIIGLVRVFRLQAEVRRLTDRIKQLETRTPRPPVPPPPAAHEAADRVAPPPLPVVTQRPAAPYVPPPPLTAPPVDIEAIGGRWLQHAGLIVLVLGVAFFLRYAFDRQWLSPAVRLALGGVVGAAMAVGGLRLSQT